MLACVLFSVHAYSYIYMHIHISTQGDCTADLSGLLLVSTVDGQVHALDVSTGERKWSFGTDDPMLTTSLYIGM
jgi:outer membrane protein assembly factor BamB